MTTPFRSAARLASMLLLVSLLAPARAGAVQFETEIAVETEEDVYELLRQGQISEDTHETLVELLRDGVDLNKADRDELYELPNLTYDHVDAILAYRKQVTTIQDPAELVRVQVLTARELEQIAPFLVVGSSQPSLWSQMSGSARAMTLASNADPHAPPMFLQLRASGPHALSAGLLGTTTRARPGKIYYDSARDALSAGEPTYSAQVPKFFLLWKGDQKSAIAGTYRIGFGQRLTLDNTTRTKPDGFFADDTIVIEDALSKQCRLSDGELDSACTSDQDTTYSTSDFKWREPFRGVAGSWRAISLGGQSELSLHGFASYQSRNVYQYEIYDTRRCEDPSSDADECKSPPVFVRNPDPTDPSARLAYSNLPAFYDELAAGGHARAQLGPMFSLGATGYFARGTFDAETIELDWRPSARYPAGGPFGAVGADAAGRFGRAHLFLEVARSLDSTAAGGGFGALQRSVVTIDRHELELTLRYYDREFANPYARPISQADEYEGLRARNEAGTRLRYLGRVSRDWELRGWADVWWWPEQAGALVEAGTANLNLLARADYKGLRVAKLGGWAEYKNKDLSLNGYGRCYETGTDEGEGGEDVKCAGELYRVAAFARAEPWGKRVTFSFQLRHEWLDDAAYATSFRRDLSVWVGAVVRPTDNLRFRVRTRWLDEDVATNQRGENTLWSYLEGRWVLPGRAFEAALRYDLLNYFDERPATLVREPSPEHRGRFELLARF